MIRDIPSLTRPGISLAVGLSALAGYVMAAGALSGGGALFAGTFALSAAVSVLNQIQERGRDARMERTRNRPLASGRMSVVQGCLIFALLLALSATLLWSLLSWRALPVLLVVLGLYNGLYTLMKPVTGWAMIPGAACGALPFWIGWVAGGGRPVLHRTGLFLRFLFRLADASFLDAGRSQCR
ncbi:heme O synthase-like polyprenyltransferase [Desulfomicrobium macestii]|uniref:heme o synthase n=1 Tax=Desulfomicrobium macestii TaxID=90731 RepID=A0ABR9H7J1_9BACT|nr:UbiA family prenyltransferase [Desulfomicrobium macestii]MBE1426684.1 heme O synthase-like polyprenyltransferase [Desulfomicrobium macestii]